MAKIFISYRRDDSPGYAGRLFDGLQQQFGHGNVFIDVDTLQPGDDFTIAIQQTLSDCDAVMAVIGPRWLAAKDDQGRMRLEDENDFVRLEIATALERQVRTIPVLVERATMPRQQDLPAPLKPLARLQAIELSDTRWDYDVSKVVDALKRALQRNMPEQSAGSEPAPVAIRAGARRWRSVYGVGAGALVLALGLTLFFGRNGGDNGSENSVLEPATPAASPAAPAPEPVNPDTCQQGYVWREAFPGDTTCVTVQSRAQAAEDNANAESRRNPADRSYGPNTCREGFVWREAQNGDVVCVTPEIREQIRVENALAPSRRIVQ